MAKSVSIDDLILQALQQAMADPAPRKLLGTKANPGIFLGSGAPVKAASQRCLDLGMIQQCGEQKAASKKAKPVPLYGIAPAGLAYLLEHDPAREVLAAAQSGVENLSRLTAGCREALVQVQEHLARLGRVVQDAAARIEPPDVQKMLAAVASGKASPAVGGATAAVASGGEALGRELQSEMLRYVHEQRRESPLRPVELPQWYRFARSRHPALTLGQFHDLVRRMAEARQIRLSPFTQAMYQLSEPECAMIVGREVMYYVEAV